MPDLDSLRQEAEAAIAAAKTTAELEAGIPMREGLDSLNVAMAATVALYERFRMARHA